jgi:hypothetical protein
LKIVQSEAKIDCGGHHVPSNRTKNGSFVEVLPYTIPAKFVGSQELLVNISVIMTYNLE